MNATGAKPQGTHDEASAAQAVQQRIAERRTNLATQLALPEPAFVEFTDGRARVTSWRAGEAPAGGSIAAGTAPDGRSALQIVAGPATSTAWRATALLRHGYGLRPWALPPGFRGGRAGSGFTWSLPDRIDFALRSRPSSEPNPLRGAQATGQTAGKA